MTQIPHMLHATWQTDSYRELTVSWTVHCPYGGDDRNAPCSQAYPYDGSCHLTDWVKNYNYCSLSELEIDGVPPGTTSPIPVVIVHISDDEIALGYAPEVSS